MISPHPDVSDDPRDKVTRIALAQLGRAQRLTTELAAHTGHCHACWATDQKCAEGAALWKDEQEAWDALEKMS